MRRRFLNMMLLLVGVSGVAHAERVVEVNAGDVRLAQIWTAAPADLAELSVGSAPPPGSSRLIVRTELSRRLSEQGADVKGLALPSSVRIKTLADQWSPARLGEAAQAAAEQRLRPGVQLKRVAVRAGQTVPAGSTVGELQMTAIPRRVGEVTLAATLTLQYAGQTVRRVPVSLVFEVSEQGALPLVAKGASVQLVVAKSSAQVSALAEALQDGDVGDVIQFRVQATRRVVQGVVESQHRARVATR